MDPTWEWTRIIQFHIYFLNHIHQCLNLFSSPFALSNLVQSQLRICCGFLFLFHFILFHLLICDHFFLAATHELYYYSFSTLPPQPLTSRRLVSPFLCRRISCHLATRASSVRLWPTTPRRYVRRSSITCHVVRLHILPSQSHRGARRTPFLLTRRLI